MKKLKIIYNILPKNTRLYIKKKYLTTYWKKYYGRYIKKIENNHQVEDDLLMKLIFYWGNTGWSSGPNYLQTIIQESKNAKKLILECGSGLSTLIMAPIAEKTGVEIISLEDNAFWGQRVVDELINHGLKKSILHHVELKKYNEFDWYNTDAIKIGKIDLCICDAPPGSTRGGRTGLFYLHGDKFIKGGKILVDDMIRKEEQDMVADWKKLKSFDILILGDIDKHAVLTITD